MRISDWSSDVCSSDLTIGPGPLQIPRDETSMDGTFLIGGEAIARPQTFTAIAPSTGEILAPDFSISQPEDVASACRLAGEAFDVFRELAPSLRAEFLEAVANQIEALGEARSEEHTSELQSLMRISYAVLCLKKKKPTTRHS